MTAEANRALLAAKRAEVEQQRALYRLRREQLDALAVRAGIAGVVQEVPVEIGQQVAPGTMLARVAEPTRLKAELRVPATRARDVRAGQTVSVDTRNGVVDGTVARVDPSVREGTVMVEVRLDGDLPRRRTSGPGGGRHHRDRASGRRAVRRAAGAEPGERDRRPVPARAPTASTRAGSGRARPRVGEHHRDLSTVSARATG